MRVLVTGGAGYVGSVLVRLLADRGHPVRVVDSGFFGLDHLDQRAELISGNILDFDPEWLDGIDAVVHLAGLSNDPMAAFSPSLNYLLNAGGAAIVAHAAKDAGVHRFVFGSTCSVYGLDDGEPLTEEHPTNPPFPYAISKLMAERQLDCLTDATFRPIILRKGTVVGWSPRMRYDLVTNTMIKTALVEGKIVVHNPRLWRPLIDVEDACAAYQSALEADLEITGIFNISGRNFTLEELGTIVADGLRNEGINVAIHTENRADVRSYRVATDKAASVLGFEPRKPMSKTVSEVIKKAKRQPVGDLEHPRYYNIRQMERLMAEGRLNNQGRSNGRATEAKHAVAASTER